jgi:uncharacterized protein (TIGR03067 family)
MSVRKHRIAALSILVSGVIVLLAWGRSMAIDSGEILMVREKFQGPWVASSIKAGVLREVKGDEAEACSVVFDGKAATFRGMVGNIDASGTFYIESSHPGWIDLKLDAGWIVGIYQIEGETLKLCLNPFAGPERLGIPTLSRPRDFDPGERRHVYVFRKETRPTDGR